MSNPTKKKLARSEAKVAGLQRDVRQLRLLVKAASLLLENAVVDDDGGPTDWEETKGRWQESKDVYL